MLYDKVIQIDLLLIKLIYNNMLFILIMLIMLSIAGLISCTGNYYINKDKLDDTTMSNKPYYNKKMKMYKSFINIWFITIVIFSIIFLLVTNNLDIPVWK